MIVCKSVPFTNVCKLLFGLFIFYFFIFFFCFLFSAYFPLGEKRNEKKKRQEHRVGRSPLSPSYRGRPPILSLIEQYLYKAIYRLVHKVINMKLARSPIYGIFQERGTRFVGLKRSQNIS